MIRRFRLAIALLCIYVAYVAFFYLGIGFLGFFKVDWWVPAKALLILLPIYLICIFRGWNLLSTLDFRLMLSPLVVYFLIIVFIKPGTLMNSLIVEPEIVINISGAYLFTIPLRRFVSPKHLSTFCIWFAVFIYAVTIIVIMQVPPLPE